MLASRSESASGELQGRTLSRDFRFLPLHGDCKEFWSIALQVDIDGIVFSLQAGGGISVYFSELIRYLRDEPGAKVFDREMNEADS